jgi:protein gp37
VVGGESGPDARPFEIQWARSIIAQCKAAGIACFMKQVGSQPYFGMFGRVAIRDRKGGDQAEWPEYLRVREYPA